MITAEIIADSCDHPKSTRLTTFRLTYPRFIHSEFMTHRCFSRNAASSRAIPLKRMVDAVREAPAHPEFWGLNQAGMQAAEQGSPLDNEQAHAAWCVAAEKACHYAEVLGIKFGLHKQIANRVIEPFSHITVIATSELQGLMNFFSQRAQKDAQPEFQILAYRMLNAYLGHDPVRLDEGQWHMPFCPEEDMDIGMKLQVATARIARVSYMPREPKSIADDLELCGRLLAAKHLSPFEHCAMLDLPGAGNFGRRWMQFRQTVLESMPPIYSCWTAQTHLEGILENRPTWFTL